MARFHQYSWNNCLLISLQRSNATHVAGFHAWQKLGRSVRKGEKGIAILAPVIVKREGRDGPSTTTDNAAILKQLVGSVSLTYSMFLKAKAQNSPSLPPLPETQPSKLKC